MRILALLAVALFATAALAGCADDPEGEGTTTSSSGTPITYTGTTSRSTTTTTTSSASATTTSSGSQNGAPTGSLAASAASGGLPLRVNFTVAGSDPDGDTLVWDLDFGDGNTTSGTVFPSTASHNYTKAGDFKAVLVISDGQAQATYDTTIKVTGTAAPAQQAFAGSWVAGNPVACNQIMNGGDFHSPLTPLEGVGFTSFAIEPVAVGKPFLVTIAPTAPVGLYEIDFYDAGGANLAYYPPTDPTAVDVTEFGGTVPAGAASATFFPCTAGPGDFTFTAPV